MAALIVDAWLEREEPIIRLHSGMSEALIAEWRGSAVYELIEQGTVTCNELFSTNRRQARSAAQ